MLKKLVIFTYLVFSSLNLYSQYELKIELKDAETNAPISFATIRFKGTNRGLVADYDGQFRLPYTIAENVEQIIVTSMGYESTEINLNTLDKNNINIITVRPQIENLDTVILNLHKNERDKIHRLEYIIKAGKKMLASEIVERAIKQIPNNLDNKNHSYIGYYRDYQFVNNKYYNLNEGVLEQFDGGIQTFKRNDSTNKEVFYSFKQNADFETSETYALQYDGLNKFIKNAQILGFGGNELSILNVHNPIRNYNTNTFSYVYQLNRDFLNNHTFKKSDIYLVDGEPVITINFSTLKELKKTYFSQAVTNQPNKIPRNKVEGNLTIALTDFSIYRFNYTMHDFNDSNPLFNVNIEYRKENGKMYLNYISFNNRFEVAEDFTFSTSDIIFNKKDYTFEVTVNSDLDYKTVKKRNFRIKFNGQRVMIKSVNTTDQRNIKIKVNDYDGSLAQLSQKDMQLLNFLIRDMKDSYGREIYKTRTITAYQFREYFVQEVFKGKAITTDLKYMSKIKPLNEAQINYNLGNSTSYIINSPLQKRRIKSVN